MDNSSIADNFSFLSKLMEIHGVDTNKIRSYATAAFTIDKLPVQLSAIEQDKIFLLKGIGPAIGKKIIEQLTTGRLTTLDELVHATPLGILELMRIKGLGPKKVAIIWRELGIESVGELLYACEENRLLHYKGFGAKSQQNIEEAIRFYLACQGSFLYAQIQEYALSFTEKMQQQFKGSKFLLTGSVARHLEIIHKLEWVTTTPTMQLHAYFSEQGYEVELREEGIWAKGADNIGLEFFTTNEDSAISLFFKHNCSIDFFAAWQGLYGWSNQSLYTTEEEIFASQQLPFIPAYLREDPAILQEAKYKPLSPVVQVSDIKGIIHSHSTWSDGTHSLEVMAEAAIAKGYQYMVISDHSQSAFYANGLTTERVTEQHKQIAELNEKLKPFKIFKSIESDILNDGSLDYSNEILESFDLVIASVHSNLKMPIDKAMARLLKAISNPFTTILGHMTGRLLLSRNGYPVDHEKIIEACALHNVVIELNAHPRRLDIDWRFIKRATEKNVFISINPDAHAVEGFSDVQYGVIAAQKGGLTKEQNLSSFDLPAFEKFLQQQKNKRQLVK